MGPGKDNPVGGPHRWFSRPMLQWSVTALVVLLPVVLLAALSLRLATRSVNTLVDANNASAAMITGELIELNLQRTVALGETFASIPEVRAAMERRDVDLVRRLLKGIADVNRHIVRAFVTDPPGVAWSDFPHAPESIGQSFAHREWYQGVSSGWTPHASEVYRRNALPAILIVAVAVPVRSMEGKVVGIVVLQLPLEELSRVLKPVTVGQSGYVMVLDHAGRVAAHPTLNLQSREYDEYANLPQVRQAIEGRHVTERYRDPVNGREMVATFLPVHVGTRRWVVIAEQPADEAYAPLRQLRQNIMLSAALLACVMAVWVVALTRGGNKLARLNATLNKKNQDLENLAEELEMTATSERAAKVEALAAHEKLRDTQAHLVQTEKLASLGQLVAGVAHEINNPLAFVSNNVAVLQREVKELLTLLALYRQGQPQLAQVEPALAAQIEDAADRLDLQYVAGNLPDMLDRSRDGLKRIQQIVKDLRDFARQESIGDQQEDADLIPGIQSTLNIVAGLARRHGVELSSDLQPLPGVTCSPAKINQVVLNLVTNAVDACQPGGKVTVSGRPAGEDAVEIRVADTGSGIPPEIRERIFDPFFTTKPQGQGTGLGLSISHGIIRDQGGTISVESEVSKGTTVVVRIPRVPPPKEGRPPVRRTNGDAVVK